MDIPSYSNCCNCFRLCFALLYDARCEDLDRSRVKLCFVRSTLKGIELRGFDASSGKESTAPMEKKIIPWVLIWVRVRSVRGVRASANCLNPDWIKMEGLGVSPKPFFMNRAFFTEYTFNQVPTSWGTDQNRTQHKSSHKPTISSKAPWFSISISIPTRKWNRKWKISLSFSFQTYVSLQIVSVRLQLTEYRYVLWNSTTSRGTRIQ